jgi:preprotein translocase subunit SecE
MGLKIYKRGQGYYIRLYTALALFFIVATGSYVLNRKLLGTGIWIEALVPAAVCIGFGLLIYWLVNTAKIAEFLISSEGEVKKVSWSSRKEITASTIIVISVVLTMAVMLWAADMLFSHLFMNVFKIY